MRFYRILQYFKHFITILDIFRNITIFLDFFLRFCGGLEISFIRLISSQVGTISKFWNFEIIWFFSNKRNIPNISLYLHHRLGSMGGDGGSIETWSIEWYLAIGNTFESFVARMTVLCLEMNTDICSSQQLTSDT